MQVKDAACKGEPRLPLVRNCTAKCPTYHWVPSPWGSCSEPCGGGKQNRTVKSLQHNRRARFHIWLGSATYTCVLQAVCIGSNGKTAHKHKCQELEKGFDTVQRCNMHSCTFPQSTFCLSDAMCPSNAQCRLLSCSDDACKQAEHWGKKVQFAQQLEAYARDPLPSPWEPLPGADAGLSRFYTANLKVNNAGEVKSGACLGQGSCIGKVVDELPWYIR